MTGIIVLALVGLAVCYVGARFDLFVAQWLGAACFMAALGAVPYGGVPL
jgi:hypothetical protein